MSHLVAAHLRDRRRSVLAWGIPLGLWSAFIVSIFPSIEDSISKAVDELPRGAEGSLRDQRTGQRRAVPAGRDAEPDRAAGDRLSGGAGDRQRALGRGGKRTARRAALGAGLAPGVRWLPASPAPRSSWRRCWR